MCCVFVCERVCTILSFSWGSVEGYIPWEKGKSLYNLPKTDRFEGVNMACKGWFPCSIDVCCHHVQSISGFMMKPWMGELLIRVILIVACNCEPHLMQWEQK